MPSRLAAEESPLRPKNPPPSLGMAVQKGFRAARQNFSVMAVLLTAMSAFVAVYYCWPAGAAVLSPYATWQQTGGIYTIPLGGGAAGGGLFQTQPGLRRGGGSG